MIEGHDAEAGMVLCVHVCLAVQEAKEARRAAGAAGQGGQQEEEEARWKKYGSFTALTTSSRVKPPAEHESGAGWAGVSKATSNSSKHHGSERERGVREEGMPVCVCVMHADTGGKGQELIKERESVLLCVNGVCSGTDELQSTCCAESCQM